ncbi:glycosyltransferase family 2 protein [Rhodothermus marinus]|uniref:glycosyltransferase family 2 protein n=1 Tax=Rhodothermus marinus TaxID=29549 RepID=UPI001DCFB418|nr:glycosyltransferase family 2 protein [Rhodothermus marinus]MBO2492706.1 glycosyltransferase family 2 protein [Rhodothermus marinus]
MESAPSVSVIIVSWNARHLLERCLPSVVATDYPNLEIILADNGSTDGSAEWVAATFPEVRIVRHPENWAFCRGNNAAIPHARGRYVVLLNNDVEVPPEWLWPLVRRMEADPTIGAVQPKLRQYHRRTHFEYAGAAGGFLDRYGYPFTRGRLFDTVEADEGQYDDHGPIFWATGAAIMLRREALDRVGLLDEHFVLHMEEIDLCWRLQRAGYRIELVPESVVYHLGGSSLPRHDPRKTYYNFRNSLLLLYKNLPPTAWRRTFPVRALLDVLAFLRFVLLGKWGDAAAVVRAYRDAHRMRHLYRDQRPMNGEAAVLPPYRGSIALDYFLLRRRRFRELPARRFLNPWRRA